MTPRSVHPSIVVGLVSGTGVSFVRLSRSLALSWIDVEGCCKPAEWSIVDGPVGAAPKDGFARLLADEAKCFGLSSAPASPTVSRTVFPMV